jgi:hypothetical protein
VGWRCAFGARCMWSDDKRRYYARAPLRRPFGSVNVVGPRSLSVRHASFAKLGPQDTDDGCSGGGGNGEDIACARVLGSSEGRAIARAELRGVRYGRADPRGAFLRRDGRAGRTQTVVWPFVVVVVVVAAAAVVVIVVAVRAALAVALTTRCIIRTSSRFSQPSVPHTSRHWNPVRFTPPTAADPPMFSR